MTATPHVLYVSFDVHYINPTRELFISALSRATTLSLYGPGYVSPDVLNCGLAAYVNLHGPYDAVFVDEFAIQDFSNLAEVCFKSHACRFDRRLLRLGAEYFDFMKRCKGRRCIVLLQSDYHNFPVERIDRVEAVADYFFTWGEELIAESAGGGNCGNDLDAQISARWQDNYLRFVQRKWRDIVSLPHIIGESEFAARPIASRPVGWTIVGADYGARLRARSALDAAGVDRAGRYLPYVFAGFDKVGVNPYAHYWSTSLLQRLFRRALTRARYGYTCGSVARMAVRKFFEIPAAGCVLVASPCEGFSDLGFVDGENAIICEGENVVDVHQQLEASPDLAQRIANAGRRLVAERHSVAARAAQIGAALDLIIAGEYLGSSWQAGEFTLHRKTARSSLVTGENA